MRQLRNNSFLWVDLGTRRAAMTAALMLAGTVAQADDAALAAEAKKCAALDGAGLRMTCYDGVFKGDGKAVIPDASIPKGPTKMPGGSGVEDVPVAPLAESNWVTRRDKSSMTDQENITLSLTSNEEVLCRQYGGPSYVTMIVRCHENTTAFYVTGDCHLASGFQGYGKVMIRLDDGKPFSRNMNDSTDSSALGLWSGGDAIPLLKQMMGKTRMITRFTPFGANPVEPSFNIAGFDEAVKPLRAACGW